MGVWDFVTVQTNKIFVHENFVTKGGGEGLKSRFYALRNKWMAPSDPANKIFVSLLNLHID